MDRVYVKH